jgi:hypothetical protein
MDMTSISFGKTRPIVNGQEGEEVEVVLIERGPGNVTAFPVNEEAEKDENGKPVTYGEKYKEYRGQGNEPDLRDPAIEPTPYDPDPSPDAHLYPPEPVPKADEPDHVEHVAV